MASTYRYDWDSVNQKKRYAGKYPRLNALEEYGQYGSDDAGRRHALLPKDAGNKREFVGSEIEEYKFANTLLGVHTIPAESYQEALRIAISMGFTEGDYRKRPGRRGKR